MYKIFYASRKGAGQNYQDGIGTGSGQARDRIGIGTGSGRDQEEFYGFIERILKIAMGFQFYHDVLVTV